MCIYIYTFANTAYRTYVYLLLIQWQFQEPKLEVPYIYIYVCVCARVVWSMYRPCKWVHLYIYICMHPKRLH